MFLCTNSVLCHFSATFRLLLLIMGHIFILFECLVIFHLRPDLVVLPFCVLNIFAFPQYIVCPVFNLLGMTRTMLIQRYVFPTSESILWIRCRCSVSCFCFSLWLMEVGAISFPLAPDVFPSNLCKWIFPLPWVVLFSV